MKKNQTPWPDPNDDKPMPLKAACERYQPNADGVKERQGYVCPRGSGMKWFPCVAVKRDKMIHVRDTKDGKDTTLSFTKTEWKTFVAGVKNGEFDV